MISTVEERNSLRFYQGDIESYEVAEDENFKSEFYQTKGAYNLLNVLMHPGMENEYARFFKESKKIPYNLFDDLEELIKVYKNIFALMCKSMNNQSKVYLHLYRVERMQAIKMVEAGYTYNFTSCSLENNPDPYFMKKDGILLLEWDVPLSVPHILVNDILGRNKFAYQEELLLSPFIRFKVEERKFTEAELRYRDVNGESPKAKYNLKVLDDWEYSKKYNILLPDLVTECEQIKNILQKIQAKGAVTDEEREYYCKWKERFQIKIKMMFDAVYNISIGEGSYDE